MTKPRQTNARYYGTLLVVLVMVVLAVQLWIYAAVIDRTVGIAPFAAAAMGERVMSRDPQVAVLRSETTARLVRDHPEYYFDLSAQWMGTLADARISASVISDLELSRGVDSSVEVLVVPMGVCLGEDQRRSIRAYLRRGGGLIASGAMGGRDAACNWQGFDFLTEITGLTQPSVIPPAEGHFACFRGNQYYSSLVPSGYNLDLPAQELTVGVTRDPDAFWGDSRLRPFRGKSPNDAALAVRAQRGNSRVVWFGFRETLAGPRQAERAVLNQYLLDSVRWAGRRPLASVAAWPSHRSSAVLVAAQGIQDAAAIQPAARLLREENIPGTFFIPGPVASRAPGLVRQLAASGEIASAGDESQSLSEQEVTSQGRLLTSLRDAVRGSSGGEARGFYPPQTGWDNATVGAMRNAGFTYYLDPAGAGRGVPEIVDPGVSFLFRRRTASFTRISRFASDDFETIADYSGPSPYGQDLAELFMTEYQRTRYLGGLYTLAFRPDLLGAPENLPVLKTLLGRLRSEGAWFATGSQLTSWWNLRRDIRADARIINLRRLRLGVTNQGEDPVEQVSIRVHLPIAARNYRLIPSILGGSLPKVRREPGSDEVLILDFPRLRAQSSTVFLIALDEK